MTSSLERGPGDHAGRAVLAAAVLLTAFLTAARPPSARPEATAPGSRTVFERRILPLLRANNPSSCSECHLSGVDLKDYIRPTEAQTFLALRGRGMIDVQRPEASRILKFIRMSRPRTPLVTQRAREAEYAAFRDWIVAAARDPRLAHAARSPAAQRIGPAVPDAVIRHTRIDSVVASFERNVWSQQGRCMNCHLADTPDNDARVKQFGPRVAWCKPGSPEETMRTLIRQGDVDVEHPELSLLLLKPLGRVPHGGGKKMLYGDAGYKMFRSWLEDYAASVKGKYRAAIELPAAPKERLVDLKCILALEDGPAAWKDHNLRVDVYPWDAARGIWATRPAATGERGMYASAVGQPTQTNLIMFLVAPAGGGPGEVDRVRAGLGQGRYLMRYYADTAGRLEQDYTIPTNSPAFYQGAQEVEAAWNAGAGWGAPVKVAIALTGVPSAPHAAR